MTLWDPSNYLRFGDERTRPAVDLTQRISVVKPRLVIDLGCGPGNSTQVLRQRWPKARIVGLDSSLEMINAARRSYHDQEWVLGRIEEWTASEPCSVVFSNAALQWTRNHIDLMQRLFAQVAPEGALAFQIPSGAFSPRTFIDETSQDEAWADRMNEARVALTMEEPQVYYDALATRARSLDIWETEYQHVLESPASIVDWVSSTALRPFLNALNSEAEKRRFVELLMQRVTSSYTPRGDGRVLFPFRRTFVIAYA